jgi:hypothetical protein
MFYREQKTEFKNFVATEYEALQVCLSTVKKLRTRLNEENQQLTRLLDSREELKSKMESAIENSRADYDAANLACQQNEAVIVSLKKSISALEMLLPQKHKLADNARQRLSMKIANFAAIHKSKVENAATELLDRAIGLRDEFVNGLELFSESVGLTFSFIENSAIPVLRHKRLPGIQVLGRSIQERAEAMGRLRNTDTPEAGPEINSLQSESGAAKETNEAAGHAASPEIEDADAETAFVKKHLGL